MKKGLIIFLTIAMLFGMIACSEEMPVVEVSSLELNKTNVRVSSEYLGGVRLEVVKILPDDAENKQYEFFLDKEDAATVLWDDYTLGDFVEVTKDGWVYFDDGASIAESVSDIHQKFSVYAKSVNGVTAEAEFYFNYEDPATLENVTYENNTVYSGATIDLNTTSDKSVTLDFNLAENEYPIVNLSISSQTPLKSTDTAVVSVSGNKITALASGSATVLAKADEGTAEKTFTIYVNRITSVPELKAFLVDSSVTEVTDRNTQLKKATEGYLTAELTDVPGIVSATTIDKALYLNGYDVTFDSDVSNTAINLESCSDIKLTINAKDATDNEAETVILANTNMTATLFNTGANALVLNGGKYVVSSDSDVVGVYVNNASGKAELTNVEITATAADETENAIAIENLGALTATGSELVANATYAKAVKTSGTAKLTNVTATAEGNDVVAVYAEGYTTIVGGTFTACGEYDDEEPIKAVTKAIALKQSDCSVKVDDDETVFNAYGTDAIALEVNAAGESSFIYKASFNAFAKKDAVGVSVISGYADLALVDIKADGLNAYGVYNLDTAYLSGVEIDVDGKKTTKTTYLNVSNTYADVVAGIVNNKTLTVGGYLTVDVDNVNAGYTNNTDVYGIYNANSASVSFENFYEDYKPEITVTVKVDDGGAYALKNENEVKFTNVTATFSAERMNEQNSQAELYGLNNRATAPGIVLNGSNVSFTAKSYGSTTGKDLENVEGFVRYEQTKYGLGSISYQVEE